jgi:hypothetical protein
MDDFMPRGSKMWKIFLPFLWWHFTLATKAGPAADHRQIKLLR